MTDNVYVVYKPCGCVGMMLRRVSGTQTRFFEQMVSRGERIDTLTEREAEHLSFRCASHLKVTAA